jgi:hypothetical protein
MLTRRGFFKLLGFSGALPFLPTPTEKAPRSIDLLEVPVAGFQYHEGMRREVFRRLRVGQLLLLVREPDNPYGELAIAVVTEDDHKLGYIPRSCNLVPAALADQSVTLRACITELDAHAPPWERLVLKVWQEV